jgi:virginiamycin B lyase
MTTLRRLAFALLLAFTVGLVAASCGKRDAGPDRGAAAASRAKPAARPSGRLVELVALPPGSRPHGIAAGPDGSVWFTLWNRGSLGTLLPGAALSVTEVPLPRACFQTEELAPGPDGALWCVAGGGTRIVRVAAAEPHGVQVFERKGNFRSLWSIAPGPGGLFWMGGARRLVRMRATVPPEYEEYPFAYSNASALGVAVDAAGDVWFTRTDGAIGRTDPRSPLAPEIFGLPDPKSEPQGIAIGPDGSVWFTELAGNAIGRFDPARSAFQEFALPTPDAKPRGITAGPDGALWFTEFGAGKLGRIAAHEPFAVTEFAVPSAASHPWDVARGPDGNVWFTDPGADAIGRIDLAAAQGRVRASEESARSAGVRAKTAIVQATGSAGRVDGQLVVSCDADCMVSVDGTQLFLSVKGRSRTFPIAPGRHTVSAVAPATGRRATQTVEVLAGRTVPVPLEGLADPDASPTATPRRY